MIDKALIDLIDEKLDTQRDIQIAPTVPRKTTLVKLPSGEIRTEFGADGVYLVFDADCKDALPWCKAHCCSLRGIIVQPDDEAATISGATSYNVVDQTVEMRRECDGFCCALDRETRLCTIYDQRPDACRQYHCSKGLQRGWKLANEVSRLAF